jgi:Protein of unknown function (DUF2996)
MAEENTATPEAQSTDTAAEAKPAKKAKAPAIEDKPLNEFLEQHFRAALEEAFHKQGVTDLKLSLGKQPLPFAGMVQECWQVVGNWLQGKRQFNLYFLDENLNGKKAFSASTYGVPPSTIESFMIDEKKVTLDLLTLYTIQRLNGQKWLERN